MQLTTNNLNATIARRCAAAFLAATALVTGIAGTAGIAAAESSSDPVAHVASATPVEETEFLKLLNAERRDAGLSELHQNPRLANYARSWSSEMVRDNELKHSPRYTNDTEAATTSDETWRRAGENVGVGHGVQALHDAFVASQAHYDNIVGNYDEVGIGVVIDNNNDIWVTFRFADIDNHRTGNGIDSVGVRRDGVWHLRHTNTTGEADKSFKFGDPNGTAVMGDWNGDGVDTIGVRTGNKFELRNTNAAGPVDITIYYGRDNDEILVGDWDGNGTDTLAVRRGNHYYFRNDLNSGPAHEDIYYGRDNDEVHPGDWDGNGTDTLVVRRANHYYFRNDMNSGPAQNDIYYGRDNDIVVIGDWDAKNGDSIGIHRGNKYYLRNHLSSGPADNSFTFGTDTDEIFAGDF